MPRRKRTPEEIARKERTKALMKELNIKDMDDKMKCWRAGRKKTAGRSIKRMLQRFHLRIP